MIPPYRVVGIDPSLTATGLAFDNGQLVLINLPSKLGDNRLQVIHDKTYELAGSGYWKSTPTLAVIEDLPQSARMAGKLGMAQGACRMALLAAGASLLAIPPATLKKFATGKGNATKAEMIEAWNEFAHAKETDDNRVDAAWLREIGRRLMRQAEAGTVYPDYGRMAVVQRYYPTAQAVYQGQRVQ